MLNLTILALFANFAAFILCKNRVFIRVVASGTKNAMALETAVFYYGRSVLLSARICCNVSQESSIFREGAQGHSLQLVHNDLQLCTFVGFWALS